MPVNFQLSFYVIGIVLNVMLPARKLGKNTNEEIEHDAMEKLKLLQKEQIELLPWKMV